MLDEEKKTNQGGENNSPESTRMGEQTIEKSVEDVSITETTSEVVSKDETTLQDESKGEGNAVETFDLKQVENKKKKLPGGLIVILVLLCIAGVAGIYAYKYFTANPTGIVKKILNDAYEEFSKNLEKIDTPTGDIDLFSEAVRVTGEFKFNDRSTNGLDKEKIEYDMALDYAKKKAEGMASLVKDGTKVGDAKVYLQNDKMYMGSTTMFDNIYDMGEYKFDEMFNFEDLKNIDMSEVPTTDDIDFVVRELKDALLDSLDEKSMTLSKETLKIGDKSIKTNKIVYAIDNASMEKLRDCLITNILDNSELIIKMAEMSGEDEADIRESLEEARNQEISEEDMSGQFAIYTTGLDYSVVKVELDDGVDRCYMVSYDDKTSFVFDADDTKIEIEGEKDGKKTDVDVKIGGQRVANLSVREVKKGVDFDYQIMMNGIEVEGTVKSTYEQKNTKEIMGELNFSLNGNIAGETLGYELSLTYDMKAEDSLESIDTSKALKEFTASDTDKMMSVLEKLEDSALFGYFGSNMLGTDDDYYGDVYTSY